MSSRRVKINRTEGTPIDVSGWHERMKLREEVERNKKIEEQRLEKERIDKIQCPVCKSTDKIHHIKQQNNGVMGPGHSSWVTENYLVCKICGVHYSDLYKLNKIK
jgi:transposase-like protein